MFRFLPAHLRGCVSLMGYMVNSLFWVPLLVAVALVRAPIAHGAWQRWCGRLANAIAENWIMVNNANQRLTGSTRVAVNTIEGLERNQSYLILSNHQSWVDILVLQRIFNRRIPLLKFFVKKELFWFPVMGQAWWALDFPFIKRYSASFLKRHPHLRGKDIEITRKACRKFKTLPVAVMNFVEGTRFTRTKHRQQRSPYAHLLKAKAGGIALVLDTLGDGIKRVLDVTIVYPHGDKSFWSFLCGRIPEIRVRVDLRRVDRDLRGGDYAGDPAFRQRFQRWLNDVWHEKDRCIETLTGEPETGSS